MKPEEKNYLTALDPYHSIERTLNPLTMDDKRLQLGIKNTAQIPFTWIAHLEENGKYQSHTVDCMAYGGRAVDMRILNPITGHPMTGSSSGTAVNVLLGINDIGIGTDGGGSVLAPAMSVNLYGFISYLIEREHLNRYTKISTDGISFSPSIGYITRDYKTMMEIVRDTVPLNDLNVPDIVYVSEADNNEYPFYVKKIPFPDVYGQRKECISFLQDTLKECAYLISYEGPVDLNGLGDSVFGHFDERTSEIQRSSCKGLIRVVNMVKATAIAIPSKEFGCSYVLICESDPAKIKRMLVATEQLVCPNDELIERYFRSYETYFKEGFRRE